MPIPIIAVDPVTLGVTLGTGLAVGVQQRRKMQRQLHDTDVADPGTALNAREQQGVDAVA